ncbi:ArnT family glycosyltransferase [Patescibacteria group bacterium]
MKKSNIILILIILIASILRLWKLAEVPVSLFGDELDVGYHAYSILKTGRDYSGNFLPLHFQSLAEWRTPLYLYSVVPTVAMFGISPLGVRLPAALFGIVGVIGMYLFAKEIGRYGNMSRKKTEILALIATTILTFSPWHIQYSRAAFEVTLLIVFYLFGLFFFFKSIGEGKSGKWLWISVSLLITTPLIYSTAKLFTPILLILLFGLWFRELLTVPNKYLIYAIIAGMVLGIPTAYATLYSGGTQRYGYISIFTDPSRETEVGVKRQLAADVRGEEGLGIQPKTEDKVFYNKFTFWGQKFLKNYFEPFSTSFLFVKGDLNLRHSIEGIAQFYKVEAIALILGLIFFFTKFKDRKIKALVAFWIVLGVIPSAITRDGGMHATRLVVLLPPLVLLISYGIYTLTQSKKPWNYIFISGYVFLFVFNFVFYQNAFWRENLWYSERWWHSGYEEAINTIQDIESEYDNVLITMASEPSWIFFAAWSEYDPVGWQKVKPDKNWIDHEIFGRVTTIDKYIFGSPPEGLYEWGKKIDNTTLFLASEKEVGINLIREPNRTPGNLTLIKSIAYPSGEPAFYIFSGK